MDRTAIAHIGAGTGEQGEQHKIIGGATVVHPAAPFFRAAVGMGIPMGIPMGMGMGWVWEL